MFDSISYRDTCTIWLQGYQIVRFNVQIERNRVPVLMPSVSNFSSGKQELHEKVTVVVKTFLRYKCLNQVKASKLITTVFEVE